MAFGTITYAASGVLGATKYVPERDLQIVSAAALGAYWAISGDPSITITLLNSGTPTGVNQRVMLAIAQNTFQDHSVFPIQLILGESVYFSATGAGHLILYVTYT